MSTILIKDSLRQAVEAASGGLQTVLYTAKGQPTFMNIIEKFDMSTIDSSLSGTHPAFIVDGVEKSQIYYGTYESSIKNGELLSIPNSNFSGVAWNIFNFYVAAAKACGSGFHIGTNAEWAAIALQCWKNNTQPFGNTYYGRSAENANYVGRRTDGKPAGTISESVTYSGSGPAEWRHNLKYNGISDLVGNLGTLISGVRWVGNELQIIANNDAANNLNNISATSTLWKAVDAVTGSLITPDGFGTTRNSVRMAGTAVTADYTITQAAANMGDLFQNLIQGSTTNSISTAAINLLKSLALFPISATGLGGDAFPLPPLNSAATSVVSPIRGGRISHGTGAGVFAAIERASDNGTGAWSPRLAYYQP